MAKGRAKAGKLYLLGLGLEPREHATIETLQAAGRCEALYLDGLDAEQARYVSGFCRGRVDSEAARGAPDAFVQKVSRELSKGAVVGLASLSHPFYASPLAARLVAECERAGASWETFGAVSPMGLGIAGAGVTLGTNTFGMQSFDCAFLAREKPEINREWPLVVHFVARPDRATYEAALAALSGLYGPGHAALWCLSSGETRVTDLAKAARAFESATPQAVLFVEPGQRPKSETGRTDMKAVRGIRSVAPWVKD
jgi:hypothetical protein